MTKYIDNSQFEADLAEYAAGSRGEAAEGLAETFHRLAVGIARKYRFGGVDPEDAAQDAVIRCFASVPEFAASRGTAFNYFTTVVINEYRQVNRVASAFDAFRASYYVLLKQEERSSGGRRDDKACSLAARMNRGWD